MQRVARHWRNPIRARVTPLDSSDALYIVFLAYTVKPMDNVVRFRLPCVGPWVLRTHAPIISLTCAFYPRTYCQFNRAFDARSYYWFSPCIFDAHSYYWINLCDNPVRFTHATIANSNCAFLRTVRQTCAQCTRHYS